MGGEKVGERKRFQTPQGLTITNLVHGFGFPPERGAGGEFQEWKADGVKMAAAGGRWTPCLTGDALTLLLQGKQLPLSQFFSTTLSYFYSTVLLFTSSEEL